MLDLTMAHPTFAAKAIAPAGAYGDDGSAADAERAIAQIDNAIAAVRAQNQLAYDNIDELGVQLERELAATRQEAAQALEAALADVADRYDARIKEFQDAIIERGNELYELMTTQDAWRELLDQRIAAEQGRA